MTKLKSVSIALAIVLSLYSCGNTKKKDASTSDTETMDASAISYKPTKIPEDVTKLIVDITDGNDYNNESVLLICQGGPMPMLVEKEEVGGFISSYNKKYKTYLVHQAQTYNVDNFTNNLTFDEITKESRTTIDILHKVITHFKKQGKKVYLWGFSFGFFVAENYVANYGTDDVARVLIGGGRLDMPEEIWHTFRDGGSIMFDEKGINPIKPGSEDEKGEERGPERSEDEERSPEGFNPDYTEEQMMNLSVNTGRMAAGLGQYRHTQLFADMDLSKLIVFYGEIDNIVGTLTKEEVTFLTETLVPKKRPLVIKGIGIGHGFAKKGKNYTLELMEALFSK